MHLHNLRSFLVLAETLHFGKAAARLNITQPPLSRQIAALEQAVGTRLFSRHSRMVALTPAGKNFQRNVKRLLDDYDFAVRSAQATARGERGELRIGFTMCAAWSVLPDLLAAFAEACPDVAVKLDETLPRDISAAITRGDADIGITFPTPVRDGMRCTRVFEESLCAVLPERHPLAGESAVRVEQLAGEKFVTFPGATAPELHDAVMSCCRHAGFEPDIHLETHLQQTIVNLVARGMGISLVPESMRRMQVGGAVFRPLHRSVQVKQGVFWSERNSNPCLRPFLDCVESWRRSTGQPDSGESPEPDDTTW